MAVATSRSSCTRATSGRSPELDPVIPGNLFSIPPRPPRARRVVRRTVVVLACLIAAATAVAAGVALWMIGELRASLPPLDGVIETRGVTAEVVVERDALGIPTMRGADRLDVAFATGFVHAQDRFFQMDLTRRRPAGELAELVGPAAIALDRDARIHDFRSVARRAFRRLARHEQELLRVYANGVNEGLAHLGAAPFEYLLLRRSPAPWRPEDSVLLVLAQFLDLQDEGGIRESNLGVMANVLPEPLRDFLTPRGTRWDAPLRGPAFDVPPVPTADVFDLRAVPPAAGETARRGAGSSETRSPGAFDRGASNSWAVAGTRTVHGGALLANDMHLRLTVPNAWYRAAFVWPDETTGEEHRIVGATLPGTPAMVVGSNGHLAWGFTNSYADWSDLVVLEIDPDDPERYLTPQGYRRLEHREEIIRVRGADEPEIFPVTWTIWGPVIDRDPSGRPRAVRWVAHDPGAVDMGLIELERATDVDQALDLARNAGSPGLNFVVVDRGGRIAWTVTGRIPRRVGFDGRLPGSWADGTRRWDGWIAPGKVPAIVDPEGGLLWTANNRTVDGDDLRLLGDGGFDLGARARQIRDDLRSLDEATERDLLAIQLDDRAVFLERWRDLLLDELTGEVVDADPRRAEFRRLVERTWTGRASVDSVAYRLVRGFREFLVRRVFDPITAPCRKASPRFSYRWYPQLEGPLWRLLETRPVHMLDPAYDSWEELILSAVDEALDYYLEDGSDLALRTWGQLNTVRIRHDLSGGLPAWLSEWLDMPPVELPGDADMPRVQAPSFGASQRMVVSPGREERGVFHMPTGQSGHPLSEHYADAHEAWIRGEPTPFLPGETVHVLRLSPP